MQYTINFLGNMDLLKYFEMDPATGQIKVNLQSGLELDRDGGPAFFNIPIEVQDNYGGNGRKI